MSMKFALRFFALFIFVGSAVQIYCVGDRVISAFWQWYKFYNYSNDGHITISYFMFGISALLSLGLIILGIFVVNNAEERFVKRLALISSSALGIGLFSLSVLAISPLVVLVSR